jgi:hypothetical protein
MWPANDLLKAGEALREHCDAMYEAARLLRFADRPSPSASGAPIIDPTKLSVDQMFALFAALGTVGEVMDGLLCQPRFKHEDDLGEAGKMLDQLRDTVGDAREAIRAEVLTRKAGTKADLGRMVFFAAEEWVDGSCAPEPALKGLTTALADLGKVVLS